METLIRQPKETDIFFEDVNTERELFSLPPVIDVNSLNFEGLVRKQTEQFIGQVAVDTSVETVKPKEKYSLLAAIRRAAMGDPEASRLVRSNILTDMVERVYKSGHIMSVELQESDNGEFSQFGHSTDDIMANSIIHGSRRPQMRARYQAETHNKFSFENCAREGWLDDYNYVVFSLAADDMDKRSMDDEGFLTKTMSMAIQSSNKTDGKYTLESAFVAGKKSPASGRHDKQAITSFFARHGLDVSGLSATQLLGQPVLIHKSLMPNGVVDIVRKVDDVSGGTFFGQSVPRKDYIEYRKVCAEREAALEARVQAVFNKLTSEAGSLGSPEQASQRLAKLSAEQMIEQSLSDQSIDSSVFGAPAAYRIEHARFLYEQGRVEEAFWLGDEAKLLDTSRSCPGGVTNSEADTNKWPGSGESRYDSSSESSDDCEFISKECPLCHKKNVKTVSKNGVYYGACGCNSKSGRAKPTNEQQNTASKPSVANIGKFSVEKSSKKPKASRGETVKIANLAVK